MISPPSAHILRFRFHFPGSLPTPFAGLQSVSGTDALNTQNDYVRMMLKHDFAHISATVKAPDMRVVPLERALKELQNAYFCGARASTDHEIPKLPEHPDQPITL